MTTSYDVEKLNSQFIDVNNISTELLNFNIINYNKIFIYRCLQLLNNNPIDEKLSNINYKIYVINYILNKLNLKYNTFTDALIPNTILDLCEFFENNFKKIKKSFKLDIVVFNNQYVNVLKFLNTLLRKAGLHLKIIIIINNYIKSKIAKLDFYNYDYNQSINLYKPFETLDTLNYENLYIDIYIKIPKEPKVKIINQKYETKTHSLIENNCRMYLLMKNIDFKMQYKILPHLPKRKYDFAFELNNKKYIIEVDGDQHFIQSTWHENEADFNYHQTIDIIKNTYALFVGYNVIRFKSNCPVKIIKILEFFLNLNIEKQFIGFENESVYNIMINTETEKQLKTEGKGSDYSIIYYE